MGRRRVGSPTAVSTACFNGGRAESGGISMASESVPAEGLSGSVKVGSGLSAAGPKQVVRALSRLRVWALARVNPAPTLRVRVQLTRGPQIGQNGFRRLIGRSELRRGPWRPILFRRSRGQPHKAHSIVLGPWTPIYSRQYSFQPVLFVLLSYG